MEVAGVEKDEDLCHLLLDDLWEFLPQASLLKLQTLFNVGRYVGSGEQFDASVTNAIIMAKLYLLNRPFSFESAVAAAISLIPTRTGGDPIPERLRVLLSMFNIDPKLAYLVDVDYNGDCPLNSVTGARDVIALSRSQDWIVTVFRFSDPVNYFYTFYPSLLDEYDLGEDLDCVNARIDDICHDIDKDKRRVVLVWDNRRYHCIAQHPRMQPAIATPVRDILQASSVAAVGVVAGSGDSNVAARRSVA